MSENEPNGAASEAPTGRTLTPERRTLVNELTGRRRRKIGALLAVATALATPVSVKPEDPQYVNYPGNGGIYGEGIARAQGHDF